MVDHNDPSSKKSFLQKAAPSFLAGILAFAGAGAPNGVQAQQPEIGAIEFYKVLSKQEQAAVEKTLTLMRACQLENGAIDMRLERDPKNEADRRQAVENGEDPDQTKVDTIRVIPYFANHTALAFLSAYTHYEKNPEDLKRVAKWMHFYAENQDPHTGYIGDFKGSRKEGTFLASGTIDSVDAYASTFLQLADKYYTIIKNSPDARNDVKDILPTEKLTLAAQRSLTAIESVVDNDLTWAKPDYKVKFLADNVEVYGGLIAGARFFEAVGDRASAQKANALAEKLGKKLQDFWQEEQNHFAWAIMENGKAEIGIENSYPHAYAQVIGIAWCPVEDDHATDIKHKQTLWERVREKFTPDQHNPIERWVMAAEAVKDPKFNEWQQKLAEEASNFTAATNGHRPAMALLTLLEGRSWMVSVAEELTKGNARGK